MLIVPYFVDEIGEYGLNSTERMGGVCDLDLCNGREYYMDKGVVYIAKVFYVSFAREDSYAGA